MLEHYSTNTIKGTNCWYNIDKIERKLAQHQLSEQIHTAIESEAFANSITFLESFENQGSTYEDMVEKGFVAKNKKDSAWTKEEVKKLKEVCVDIQNKKIQPQVKDMVYYISHYTFHGTKSRTEIEGMINKQIRMLLDNNE